MKQAMKQVQAGLIEIKTYCLENLVTTEVQAKAVTRRLDYLEGPPIEWGERIG